MANMTLTVDMGSPKVGVWCPTCRLPAAVSVDAYLIGHSGVRRIGTATACQTCGPIRRR